MKYVQPTLHQQANPEEQIFISVIKSDPALSSFLETGILSSNAKFLWQDVYKDPDFLHFISPGFEAVFTPAIIQCFTTGNTSMMNDLVTNPLLLDDVAEEKSFCTILNFLQEKQKQLLVIWNQLQLGTKINVAELEKLTGITTISLLNYLPHEFQAFRSEYCNELVKIAQLLVRKDPEMAHELIVHTRDLDCLPQSKQRVEDCYTAMQKMETTITRKSVSERSAVWIRFFFLPAKK